MKTIKTFKDKRKSIDLLLDDDRLKLFLKVKPEKSSSDFSVGEILLVVNELIGDELIDMSVIEDIVYNLNTDQASKERRIAKGTPPSPGIDGKVVWLVKKMDGRREQPSDNKSFSDFVSMKLFDNILKGQVIARIYKPKSGTDGIDALGKPITAQLGKPARYVLDPSVRLEAGEGEDSFDIVVAQVDGYAMLDGEKLLIREELNISGDLDYRYGHIDFVGTLKISGDIHKGFNIKTRGSIYVGGSVEGDNVIVSGEDIVIAGSLFGGPRSALVAQGKCSVKVMRGARIDAGELVIIAKESLESAISTRGRVDATNATVIAGVTRVVKGADFGVLGNEVGSETKLMLCLEGEASTEHQELATNIQKHEVAANLIELHLGPYAKIPDRIQLLKSPLKEKMSALEKKLRSVRESLDSLRKSKAKLLENMTYTEGIRINIYKRMYSGVDIAVGDKHLSIPTSKDGPFSVAWHAASETLEIGELVPFEDA